MPFECRQKRMSIQGYQGAAVKGGKMSSICTDMGYNSILITLARCCKFHAIASFVCAVPAIKDIFSAILKNRKGQEKDVETDRQLFWFTYFYPIWPLIPPRFSTPGHLILLSGFTVRFWFLKPTFVSDHISCVNATHYYPGKKIFM